MNFDDYRAIDAVNFSTLKRMAQSPAHYRHELSKPHTETEATRVGSAAHCIALEPLEYPKRYAFYEGRRDKRHKAYQDFLAEHEGKTILSKPEHDRATAIGLAVHADPIAMAALDGEHEVTLQWVDPDTGLPCKARLDSLGDGVTDLKTTRNNDSQKFCSDAARMSYHAQLAWYHDAAVMCGYEMTQPPKIVAVESSAPYTVGTFVLPMGVIDVGRQEYRAWLRRVKECREAHDWPGPYTQEVEFALPHWYGADPVDFFADLELAS